MKKYALLLLMLSFVAGSRCQVSSLLAVKNLMVFTAESCRHAEAKDFLGNPACLDTSGKNWAAVSSVRQFSSGVSQFICSAGVHVAAIQLAFSVMHCGTAFFYEELISAGLAIRLSDNAEIGSRASFVLQHAAGYTNRKRFQMDAGVRGRLGAGIHYGIWLMNPLSFLNHDAYSEAYLISGIRTGFGWDAGDNWFVAADILKMPQMPPQWHAKISYRPERNASISFSFAPGQMRYSLAVQFNYRKTGIYAGVSCQYRYGPESAVFFDSKFSR